MKIICDLVVENGAGALEYANSKFFMKDDNVKIFKSAIKLHILRKYKKNREDLKHLVDNQNSLYKSIKLKKLSENILNLRQEKQKRDYDNNSYVLSKNL